ncbi:amino acid ABC transporter substrate-binding protein [Vibrio sp. JPW-9-11-11]|uniref:substrate-binding periplasmic protein n=1 Tax=Vibrio sp. JPW-9-11-11 TaxID=1416532 RepID=UPI00159337F4|nr:transporter substrate-binding domain-containing protein [Vibrio sp. JPW-9-11-11]NVD07287.1 amino acid ABC transporter substrate-binding protein [Vibrio sp. JPW-9-11-11]
MTRALLLCLSLCLAGPASLAQTSLQLVTLDYPPYIETRQGEVSGVAVKLVETVFAELNQSITIEVLPWARALNLIEYGRADAIFTAFKNPTRERFADFSHQVLFTQNISLVVRSSSSLSSQNFFTQDLSSLALCVVNRVSYGEQFDQLLVEHRFREVFQRDGADECAHLVRAGRADVWVNNHFGARSILVTENLEQALTILSPALEATPSYIAFSKRRGHQTLRARFDTVLAQMKRDGRYEALIDEYFAQLRQEKNRL